MPAKTGASHAIAAFGSIVLGAYISAHTSIVTGFSRSVGDSVLSTVGLSLPASVTGMLLISTGLAFLWGVAYHFARHGSDGPASNAWAVANPVEHADSDIPAPLDDVVTESYASADSIASADSAVQSYLAAELSAAGSVLDDVHDRLADAGERAAADRAGSLAETVREVDQRVTSHRETVSEDAVSLRDQSAIVSLHADLVTAIDRLGEELDRLEQSVPEDAPDAHFEAARQRLRDLETALDHRQQRLHQGGSLQ